MELELIIPFFNKSFRVDTFPTILGTEFIEQLLNTDVIPRPARGLGYKIHIMNRKGHPALDMKRTLQQNGVESDDVLVILADFDAYSPGKLIVAFEESSQVFQFQLNLNEVAENTIAEMQCYEPLKEVFQPGVTYSLHFLNREPLDMHKTLYENGVKPDTVLVIHKHAPD